MNVTSLRKAIAALDVMAFRFKFARCPLCGPSIFVRLSKIKLSVRCIKCGGAVHHLAIGDRLRQLYRNMAGLEVYELSSRGPFFDFLRRSRAKVTFSEFFDGVTPGDFIDGIQCQDVQSLTFPELSFDLCTSTEVLEHVPNDFDAFRELFRVLRPGGHLVFTIPYDSNEKTIERATIEDGVLKHLLPPAYHGDRLRGESKVLCFRDYGSDLPEKLSKAGFANVEVIRMKKAEWWDFSHTVVSARKPEA